jgi:hypothetical protein
MQSPDSFSRLSAQCTNKTDNEEEEVATGQTIEINQPT